MIWHIIRYWTSLLVPVFYKRIQAKNVKHLQVKGPVIIAMNHPNAFTDPVVITMTCYPPKLKYMARGDAFKPGIITWFLERLGIVPIFRIQDGGREGLKKNDEAYRRVNALLKKNAKVIIFAEGLCVQERRLRPVKKGVARMVFGAYDFLKNDELVVVPVGVNYSKPDKFRSNVFYNIGEPIAVKDFMVEYRENPVRAQNSLLASLEPKMKELISHINNPKNDNAVYMVEQMTKKDWLKDKGLNIDNLEHQLIFQKHIAEKINVAEQNHNPALEIFKKEGEHYFKLLHKNGLRDWLINPRQNKMVTKPLFILRCVLLVLGVPLYAIGLMGNLAPLWLTDRLTKKIVKKAEFYSSFAMGISMFVFLIVYLTWFFVVYSFNDTVFWPLVTWISFVLAGVFCLFYHPFLLKTFGMYKLLNNKVLQTELSTLRGSLMQHINKF